MFHLYRLIRSTLGLFGSFFAAIREILVGESRHVLTPARENAGISGALIEIQIDRADAERRIIRAAENSGLPEPLSFQPLGRGDRVLRIDCGSYVTPELWQGFARLVSIDPGIVSAVCVDAQPATAWWRYRGGALEQQMRGGRAAAALSRLLALPLYASAPMC